MPVFWVESKFSIDTEKASQLAYGLNIPWIAQLVGLVFITLGILMTIFRYLRQMCCVNATNKTTKNDRTVIKDVEKPLMSPESIMITHK